MPVNNLPAGSPCRPVDVNRAPAELLRRVPGIGPRTVDKMLLIRRHRPLRLRDLRRLHVDLRRAKSFVIAGDYRPTAPGAADNRTSVDQPRQLELFARASMLHDSGAGSRKL